HSEFEYSHDLQIGIFVVSNGPNATKTVDGILEILHGHFEAEPKNVAANIKPESNNSFAGYYILESPRNQLLYPFTELFNSGLFIKMRDNKLFISGIGHSEERLYITGSNKLSTSQDNEGYQYILDKSFTSLYTSLGFK